MGKQKKAGRPSKKDKDGDESVAKLLAAFYRGCNVSEACFYSGISRETYYRWVKETPELRDIFGNARSAVNQRAKAVVVDAIDKGDIGAAKWWLERRANSDFGPNAESLENEISENDKLEIELQKNINKNIANKYRVYLFRKREALLAEYSKKNEYLINRIDRLMKLPDKEIADYAGVEVWATGADYADVRRHLLIRLGGENYNDLIALTEETQQKYDDLIQAEKSQQSPETVISV